MQIYLSPKRFRVIVVSIVLLNIFFLAGTGIHHAYGEDIGGIAGFLLLQLDLAFENVLSAWYSSMLLFMIAIFCVLCFAVDIKRFEKKNDTYISFGWIILGLAFTVLSLDELGSFHETIGDTSLFEIFGKSEGWEVFYILIILVGGFMILFSWVRLRRVPLATVFMILGALLLLSNPLQENFEIETMQNSANPAQWQRPIMFLLIEEGSEIFASLSFLVSVMLYYRFATRKAALKRDSSKVDTIDRGEKKALFIKCCSFVIAMTILMIIIDLYVQRDPGNDIGIPRNWFPSVMSFVACCASIYEYKKGTGRKRLFLMMTVFLLALSAYCGSDLYEHSFNELVSAEKIFNLVVAALVVVYGVIFFRTMNTKLGRTFTFSSVLCIALAFILPEYARPELLFAGFALYLLMLTISFS